ncbi:type VII secretion target [Cellulomonas sp. NPDC089187]|uniref:type VII secretion target n=1 Tax=Cellulomonas sp. NPDC089187 TaxID=3154970 RepID=UPI003441CB1E
MTGFYVDPAAIQRFAARIETHGAGARTARDYADDYLRLQEGVSTGALYQNIRGTTRETHDAVIDALNRLKNLLDECRDELNRTATMYAATDTDTATTLDSTY